MTDLDPAAIMAEHAAYTAASGEHWCDTCRADWPCLTYRLAEQIASYEHQITWDVTCENCARLLDASYADTMRAEKAEVENVQLQLTLADCGMDSAALAAENAALREQIQRVRALLPEPPTPIYDPENGGSFEGFKNGTEHRTVGDHRAWCYNDSEWCYPTVPCQCCLPPIEVFDLRDALDTDQPGEPT